MYIKLPVRVTVADYHDFDNIKDVLTQVGATNFKVKEIGFDGEYHGIVYTGALTDFQNKNLINEIKEDFEDEN